MEETYLYRLMLVFGIAFLVGLVAAMRERKRKS